MKVVTSIITLLCTFGFAQVSAQTISEFVSENSDFSTLFEALQATGLDVALAGEGPFTVFAPTNDAFKVLTSYSPGTLEKLLVEEPPETLTAILTYHVVDGILTSDDITAGLTSLETLQGENITLSAPTDSFPARINNFANIIAAPLPMDNGIIYVISAALLPISMDVPPSIAIAANTTGTFNILLSLVESNQLGEELNSVGPFTVFAPTDEAFSQITDLEQIISDPQMVIAILVNHVVPGYNTAATLTDGQVLKTIAGGDLVVSIVDNVVMINDAKVTQVDIIGSNGVVHAIDTVLIPDSATLGNFTIESDPSSAPGMDDPMDTPPMDGGEDSAFNLLSVQSIISMAIPALAMLYAMLI